MKSVKWMYVSAMAIAFGMLSFATVACHDDDDDPKPAEGEVIETPKPVVEYYIKGAVTVKGEGKSGVKVKVGDKDCITDSKGEFSVTESNTGTYEVSVAPNGYLSQKTSVKIADNAENRSVVKVAFALTEVSPVKEVVLDEMTDPITVEDESTSNEAIPTTTEDFGQVEPDKVVEDMPLAKVEIVIPAGVIKEDAQEDPTLVKNGKVDISVTTFVPAPKEVVTEVKPTEVVEAVKSIPLAAAQLAFKVQMLLQQYVTDFKIEKVKANLDFVEGRYQEAKHQYEVKQEELALFEDANRNPSTSVARAAQARLTNEYTLLFGVYNELAKQREQAYIKVKETTPVFTVVEPVTIPAERSKPKRGLICIAFTFLGGFIGIGLVLILPFLAQVSGCKRLKGWLPEEKE